LSGSPTQLPIEATQPRVRSKHFFGDAVEGVQAPVVGCHVQREAFLSPQHFSTNDVMNHTMA